MAFWDHNFGIKVADYDQEAPNLQMQKRIYTQVAAIFANRPHVMVCYHHPREYHTAEQAMLESHYANIHPFFVHKTNQNAVGFKQYTFAVDSLIIGYFPNKQKVKWNASSNPLERHNMLSIKTLTKHYINPSDNKTANEHEKSPIVAELLCKNHANADDWVLVIGSGAGGEVVGALQALCNVAAVERNERKFNCFRARLTALQVDDSKEEDAAVDGEDGESPQEMEMDKSNTPCVACGEFSAGPLDMKECYVCNQLLHRDCMALVAESPESETEIFLCSENCMTDEQKKLCRTPRK